MGYKVIALNKAIEAGLGVYADPYLEDHECFLVKIDDGGRRS